MCEERARKVIALGPAFIIYICYQVKRVSQKKIFFRIKEGRKEENPLRNGLCEGHNVCSQLDAYLH